MDEKELYDHVQQRLQKTQSDFDNIKTTFLTAGLFVVVSITTPEFQSVKLFGTSGIKIVLLFTVLAALFQVLSFVVAEHQVKRHDKLLGGNVIKTKTEKYILDKLTKNPEKQAKIISTFYGKFQDKLTSLFNNMSTISILIALFTFLALVIYWEPSL